MGGIKWVVFLRNGWRGLNKDKKGGADVPFHVCSDLAGTTTGGLITNNERSLFITIFFDLLLPPLFLLGHEILPIKSREGR